MTDKITDPKTWPRRWATAHGWLRRPELDTSYGEVWEQPDGQLYMAEKGTGCPVLVTAPAFRFVRP